MIVEGLSCARPCRRSSPGTLRVVTSILCALALTPARGAIAQDGPPPLEYQVKAAFLFSFAKFVEWPPETIRGPEEGFVICVVDNQEFASALDQTVSGKTVGGRVFRVRRLQSVDEAASCRILYLGSTETSRLAGLLKSVRGTAILTIGSTQGFTRQGGIINFITQDNRVRFEINPDAAERAGLRISSKLLQLATIVRDTARLEGEP